MKTLKFIFPIFLLGLFLAGCEKEEILPASEDMPAKEESALKAAKKKHEVPFKSKFVLHSLNFYPDDHYHTCFLLPSLPSRTTLRRPWGLILEISISA